MMARRRLKPGAIGEKRRNFRYKLSEKLMPVRPQGQSGLLFAGPLATSAASSRQRYPAQGARRARPWIRAKIGVQDRHERTSVHLSHGGSDQDLPAQQEGSG